MKFGLKDQEIDFLDRNLIQPLKKFGLKIYIFGSRSTGKNHPYSDVDILLEGDVDQSIEKAVRDIKEFFEESNFPYKVDLVFDKNLASSYRTSVTKSRIEI